MKLVSDQACPETWTCQIVTPNGQQPDLAALSRCVHEVGDPFVVRGVEVTVDGNLVKKDGRLALRIAGSGEVLSLVPIGAARQDRALGFAAPRGAGVFLAGVIGVVDQITWTQLATVSPNVATFQNTGLRRNTLYYYRVRAFLGTNNSSYSNVASARTLKK